MSRSAMLFTASRAVAIRLPSAMLPLALLVAVGVASGSFLLAGFAASAALFAAVASPLVAAPAVDRYGPRPVLLVLTLLHVVVLVVLSAALERLRIYEPDIITVLLATGLVLTAGLTLPPSAALARSRTKGQEFNEPDSVAETRDSQQTMDGAEDLALIVGAGLIGMLSAGFGGSAGLLGAAVLATVTIRVAGREEKPGALPTGADGEPRFSAEPDRGVKVPSAPFPALAHAHRMFAARRVQPADHAGDPPRGHLPTPGGWLGVLSGAVASAVALGLVLGGVWITLLGLGRVSGSLGLLGAGAAGMALGAALSSRWLPQRFASLDGLRRRRFFSVLGAFTAVGLLPAAVLVPPTLAGQLLVAACTVVLGICLGVVVVELHAMVVARAPASTLHQVASAVSGAVLCGLALGMLTGGLAADVIGRGWSVLPAVAGGLLLAASTLRRSD